MNANPIRSKVLAVLTVIVLGLAGWFLGHYSTALFPSRGQAEAPPTDPPQAPPLPVPARSSKAAHRAFLGGIDPEAIGFGGLSRQRVISFASADAMRKFLASLEGTGVKLLGTLDRLNAVRVGFDDLSSLSGLLGDEAKSGLIWPVYIPPQPVSGTQPGAQPGAVGLGTGLHEFLGITGDTSAWGKGVLVAVLDTGIAERQPSPHSSPAPIRARRAWRQAWTCCPSASSTTRAFPIPTRSPRASLPQSTRALRSSTSRLPARGTAPW